MDLKILIKQSGLRHEYIADKLWPGGKSNKPRFSQKLNNTVIGVTQQSFTDQEKKDILKIINPTLATSI